MSNLIFFSSPQSTNPKIAIENAIQYMPIMNECFTTISNKMISPVGK